MPNRRSRCHLPFARLLEVAGSAHCPTSGLAAQSTGRRSGSAPSVSSPANATIQAQTFCQMHFHLELGRFITVPLNTGPLNTALLSHGPLNTVQFDHKDLLSHIFLKIYSLVNLLKYVRNLPIQSHTHEKSKIKLLYKASLRLTRLSKPG